MSDSSEDEEDVGDDEDEFEDDIEFLRSLDPKECKDQDHYRVLGLAKLRIGATDDQIKRAHRYKVNRCNNKGPNERLKTAYNHCTDQNNHCQLHILKENGRIYISD